uniref:Adenosine deaminase domain-containing protein n=1 Tax=Haptolina ericina TaxID=156174 RepID=A0A7S3AUH6_9EUKA
MGHALTLDPSQIARLVERSIPVEICPTSNMKTMHLTALEAHPTLPTWIAAAYPFSINTDDSTVFETTSSRELRLVAEAFYLPPETLVALCLGGLKHAFETDTQKLRQLHKRFSSESEQAIVEYREAIAC